MGDVARRHARAPRTGFVCGLKSERAALGAHGDGLVGVSGADPDRAEAEADRLIAAGAERLVSFGLAGGLARGLAPGDLLLPSAVIDADGTRYVVDAGWRAATGLACSAAGAVLLGSDRLVDDPAMKAALHARYAASAVDMESHRVARAAIRAGLAFLCVRAVADPHTRALPPSAHQAVGPDGGVRMLATLSGLARRPGDLPALIALGRDSSRALATLRGVSGRLAG